MRKVKWAWGEHPSPSRVLAGRAKGKSPAGGAGLVWPGVLPGRGRTGGRLGGFGEWEYGGLCECGPVCGEGGDVRGFEAGDVGAVVFLGDGEGFEEQTDLG